MEAMEPAIGAARNAERELWQHYGLAMVERFIEIQNPGLRVRMLECGNPSAEPLIFVQGGLGEACGWASLMAKLTDFRCITLDRPGGGLSDGVDFLEVDVRKLAVNVLQAVLDAAGVHQAAFVANSMGGGGRFSWRCKRRRGCREWRCSVVLRSSWRRQRRSPCDSSAFR